MADEQQQTLGISLTELAGIDLNDVKEVRFELLPQLVGQWEITEAGCKMVTRDSKQVAAIVVESTLLAVEKVIDPISEEDKAKLPGKKQVSTWAVKDKDDIGRFKAFAVDLGVAFTGPAPLDAICQTIKGHQYPGKIRHTKSKNDPDQKFANLDPIPPSKQQAAA